MTKPDDDNGPGRLNVSPDERFMVDEPEDTGHGPNYAVGYALAIGVLILAGVGVWTLLAPLFR